MLLNAALRIFYPCILSAVNSHLQTAEGFSLPGDTSEASNYFTENIAEPPDEILDSIGKGDIIMENAHMQVEQIKTAIKDLPVEDRRKVALYILELEKDYFKGTIGPQIAEDLESVTKVIQDAAEKVKQHLRDKK